MASAAAIALGAALLGVVSLGRGAADLADATTRLRRCGWPTAEPIDLPGATIPAFRVATAFPIVAVVGVVRPTLVVARSVLEACTADELAAIVAHEQAHVAQRDNLAARCSLCARRGRLAAARPRRLEPTGTMRPKKPPTTPPAQLGATGRSLWRRR